MFWKYRAPLLVFTIAILSFSAGTRPYIFPDLSLFPKMPTAIDNPVSIEGADLGRHLFYDPILSRDSSISCSSCHKQKFAFSDSLKLSSGINGRLTVRNAMPLYNLAWYPAYFWDGRANSIENQVSHPILDTNEMDMTWELLNHRLSNSNFYRNKFKRAFGSDRIDSIRIKYAIAQFERSLLSINSKFDKALRFETHLDSLEYAGFVIVNDQSKADCLHCHTTDANPLGTSLKFSNNGIDSIFNTDEYTDKGRGAISFRENEVGKFKVPSLRNVAFTAPYMHDGRFRTLEEVLNFYSEQVNVSVNIDSKMTRAHEGGVQLSDNDKKAIIAFLHTLSDSTFIRNPEFSNPF